ncbi:hypothetical protein DUI87_09426 [Hirundo rustica rustica]|uniref:SH2 domain-containing protein n=2 Tax=Sylvioidea TaxID=2116661 RepID=A0A3M0KM66_HIRRU|nr:hypothetical protein DUI87_09426 [Hirundo rustica rustica]
MITVKLAGYGTTELGLESKPTDIILNTLRDKQSLHLYCASGLAEGFGQVCKGKLKPDLATLIIGSMIFNGFGYVQKDMTIFSPVRTICEIIVTLFAENTEMTGNQKSKYLTMKGKSDLQFSSNLSEEEENVYETVSSSTLEAIHSLRILPAKPLQESEYADKRCLRPSGTTSPMSENPSQPLQRSALFKFSFDFSRPLKMLPKQYQPLPPEPRKSSQVFHERNTLSQDPTFPISAKVTRHSSVKESDKIRRPKQFQCDLEEKRDCALVRAADTEEQVNRFERRTALDHNPDMLQERLQVWGRNLKYLFKHNSILLKPALNVHGALKIFADQDLNKYEWYVGEYDRHKAEKILLQKNIDETFLVRDCSKKSKAEPYVLVVYYGRRVYNIKVRFLEESQQYALGTGLRGESKFNSVEEIIDFYKSVPITLIDGKDQSGNHREQCYLTHPFKSC